MCAWSGCGIVRCSSTQVQCCCSADATLDCTQPGGEFANGAPVEREEANSASIPLAADAAGLPTHSLRVHVPAARCETAVEKFQKQLQSSNQSVSWLDEQLNSPVTPGG